MSFGRSCTIHVFLLILLFFFSLTVVNTQEILFSDTDWNLGTISDSSIKKKEIEIQNNSNRAVIISFVSTCSCLEVSKEHIQIEPGNKGSVSFFFNPKGESGDVRKYIIIRSNAKGLEKALFPVTGTVKLARDEADKEKREVESKASDSVVPEEGCSGSDTLIEASPIEIDYYYSPGCRSCLAFLKNEIPKLEREINVRLHVNERDILDPDIYKQYLTRLNVLGIKERAFPALIVGTTVLQGEKEIKEKVKNAVLILVSGARETAEQKGSSSKSLSKSPSFEKDALSVEKIAVFPVFAAGLLDGINPCAFTTLIFLLASLAVAGRTRREILLIGMGFSLSVFITYYLIGIGVFRFLRIATVFPIIANAIRWILVTVLVVFALLSLYDFYLIKMGRAKEMVLQLPSLFKRQIHRSIKTHVRSATLISSSILLGVLVSLFELACTGQVYLPTIVYLIRVKGDLTGYLFLLLYNLGFIIPLIVVFVLTYSGVSSKRITVYFQRSMGAVKLSFFFLFVILAVLTVVT